MGNGRLLRIRTRGNAPGGLQSTASNGRHPVDGHRIAAAQLLEGGTLLHFRRRRMTRFLLPFLGLFGGWPRARFTGPASTPNGTRRWPAHRGPRMAGSSARHGYHHGHLLGLHVALVVGDESPDRPVGPSPTPRPLLQHRVESALLRRPPHRLGHARSRAAFAVVLWLVGMEQLDMARSRWLMLPYPCWLLVAFPQRLPPLHRRPTIGRARPPTERPRWPPGTRRCPRRGWDWGPPRELPFQAGG